MTTALLPRGSVRLLVIVASAAILALSCGGASAGTTDAISGHDVAVIAPSPPARPSAPVPSVVLVPSVALVASRDDLVGETRLAPDRVWIDPSEPRVLRVRFTAGAAPCSGVRLAVDAGPAMVRVVLHRGSPPEGVGLVCPAIALTQEVHFELDQPLGSRELIWTEV